MGLTAKEKQEVMLGFLKKRIDNNKNVIIIFNGETGSGKTFAALSLAEKFSKLYGTPFSVKDNVAFNFKDILNKIDKYENVPGMVFIFEEVGAIGSGAGSHEWQSKANRMFSSFGQTSRHLRQIFIMTCPLFSNLQASTRKLCHLHMQMVGINPTNNLSYMKAKRIQVNTSDPRGKMYLKYIRFKKRGERFKLKRLDMNLPSQHIIDEYGIIKTKFEHELRQEMKRMDSSSDGKTKAKQFKTLEERKSHIKTLFKGGITSPGKIASITSISPQYVHLIIKEIKKDNETEL